MSETPESRVKRFIVQWLERELGPDVYIYKPRGGPYGRAGEPDMHVCWRGIFIVIEAKAYNRQATAIQMARLKKAKKCGAIAVLIKNFDEITWKLEIVKQEVLKRTPNYVQSGAVQVASQGGAETLQSSDSHGEVFTGEQESLRAQRDGNGQNPLSSMGDGYSVRSQTNP